MKDLRGRLEKLEQAARPQGGFGLLASGFRMKYAPGHVGRKDDILRAEGFSGHHYQIEFAPRYIPANSSPIATAVTTIVREVSLIAPDRMAVTQDLAIVNMAKSLSRIADPSIALSVAPPDLGPTARRARKREQGKPIVT